MRYTLFGFQILLRDTVIKMLKLGCYVCLIFLFIVSVLLITSYVFLQAGIAIYNTERKGLIVDWI